jgi:hypothetical protein
MSPLASSQARKVVFDEVQSFAKGKVTAGQELKVNEIATLQKSLRRKLLMTEVSAFHDVLLLNDQKRVDSITRHRSTALLHAGTLRT